MNTRDRFSSLLGIVAMIVDRPAIYRSRRAFLGAAGGLGSLALTRWTHSFGAQSRVKDLLILIPGITGSVLLRDNEVVWAPRAAVETEGKRLISDVLLVSR